MSTTDLQPLLHPGSSIKVSSTLDKSSGKKNLIDGSPETCWASQQGTPQYVQIVFDKSVILKQLVITFQGGFVGTRGAICLPKDSGEKKDWDTWTHVYPEDVNRQQTFDLPWNDKEWGAGVNSARIVFEESSDFFGRITVYNIQLFGEVVG